MLKPANDAHSIKAVAFVCEFDQEISQEGLNLLSLAFKRFRARLPLKRTVRSIALQLQGESKMQPAETVAGYRYFTRDQKNSDKVWFEVSGSRAIYWTSEYVSFDSFQSEAIYFSEIACEVFFAGGAQLNKAIIEYRDEFISDTINWNPLEALRENTPFVSNGAITQGNLWHSHCGFFSNCEEGRILNNIRVDHTIENSDNEVNINYVLALTILHALSIEPALVKEQGNVKEKISLYINSLRKQHKNIFSQILNDEQLTAVGFN